MENTMTFDEIDDHKKLDLLADRIIQHEQNLATLYRRISQLENDAHGPDHKCWYLGLPGAAYATHENGDVYIGNAPGDGDPISPDRARQVARYLEAAADHAERTKE